MPRKSGVTGVRWNDQKQKWGATIKADGTIQRLGHFTEFDDAVNVRESAEIKHSFVRKDFFN